MNKKIKKPKVPKLFPSFKRLALRRLKQRLMIVKHKKATLKVLISQMTRGLMDIPQRWVKYEDKNTSASTNKLKILSYNILAECNIEASMYPGCHLEDLAWKNREGKVLKNIMDINPDIACLQEFQPSISDNLVQALKANSFEFTSKIKTGKKHEGEATFWNKNKYDLLHNFYVEMNVSNEIKELDFMNRDTIALITVLKNLSKDETIIICNTHLLFNMKRGEIKLGHILFMLKSMQKVREYCENNQYKNINSFICGDFNTIPNSLLYKLMSESQQMSLENIPLSNYSNQLYANILRNQRTEDWDHFMQTTKNFERSGKFNPEFTINPRHLSLIKNMKIEIESEGKIKITKSNNLEDSNKNIMRKNFGRVFESAYAHVYRNGFMNNKMDNNSIVSLMINKIKKNQKFFDLKRLSFEGGVTHMTNHMWLNVDYIWFDALNTLKPYQVLETIDYHKIESMKSFPNEVYPSDHVPISAEFH